MFWGRERELRAILSRRFRRGPQRLGGLIAVCGHTVGAAGAQARAMPGGPSESLAMRTRLQAMATYWPWALVRATPR